MTLLGFVLIVLWIGTGLLLQLDRGVPGKRRVRMGIAGALLPPFAGAAGLLFADFFFGPSVREAGFVIGFLAFVGLLLWPLVYGYFKPDAASKDGG